MFAESFIAYLELALLMIIPIFLFALWTSHSFKGYNSHKHNQSEPSQSHNSFVSSFFDMDQIRIKRKDFPSVLRWASIDEPKKFSLTSMVVDHHSQGSWYIPAFHDKFSAGWNHTANRGFSSHPFSCSVRFIGIALESTMKGYIRGGTGYLTLNVGNNMKSSSSKNDTDRVHCYYMTNKDYGSEFQTNPKTLGIAVTCPILLDSEIGQYEFRGTMVPGYYCRLLADETVTVNIHLYPSSYEVLLDIHSKKDSHDITANLKNVPSNKVTDKSEIISTIVTAPHGKRKEITKSINRREGRPHAVCAVQTFQNQQTGPMLYMFVTHYQSLGWSVIIYDRFGLHETFLGGLLSLPGVFYHPYTVYQLAEPLKYNEEYKNKQGTDLKVYYDVEKNWGYGGTKMKDTGEHDADKTRTYDHARLEYSFMDMILYLDADEFFFCPQAEVHADGDLSTLEGSSPRTSTSFPSSFNSNSSSFISTKQSASPAIFPASTANSPAPSSPLSSSSPSTSSSSHSFPETYDKSSYYSNTSPSESRSRQAPLSLLVIQKIYQQSIMSKFSSVGVEEMRFVRIPFSGKAPLDYKDLEASRSLVDFTNSTQLCMVAAYEGRDIPGMFSCWSSASSFDGFPKSADFAGICPFHYNHWSCDGMRNGGRDSGKNIPRCRCKVSFDMHNGFLYKPDLNKCYLMHLNTNKYRFQSRRDKHIHDKGNITESNILSKLHHK